MEAATDVRRTKPLTSTPPPLLSANQSALSSTLSQLRTTFWRRVAREARMPVRLPVPRCLHWSPWALLGPTAEAALSQLCRQVGP